MRHVLLSVLALAILAASSLADIKAKTFGKEPKSKKEISISALQAKPAKFKNKTVLLSGIITDVCKHRGCWLEIQQSDGAKIICKSMDESILFPPEVVGHSIRLQGKVLYDANASGAVQKEEEGGVAHACPAPQVLVSIDGATVADLADAAPAPEAEPKKE